MGKKRSVSRHELAKKLVQPKFEDTKGLFVYIKGNLNGIEGGYFSIDKVVRDTMDRCVIELVEGQPDVSNG